MRRNLTKRLLLILALTISLNDGVLSAQPTPASRPTVLRGATVISGTGDAPLANAIIIIENQKIVAVGGSGSVGPVDAERLEQGTPGMAQCEAHAKDIEEVRRDDAGLHPPRHAPPQHDERHRVILDDAAERPGLGTIPRPRP